MPNLDLSPLFRYSVGFDQLDKLFDEAFRDSPRDVSYPPYDIARVAESEYRITMAVAGFGEDDLDIQTQENQLTVRGKAANGDAKVQYLHRGIARRAFEHRFQLAEHVRVNGASLTNGLLEVQLVRELPEAAKVRKIAIGEAKSAGQVIDAPKAAETQQAA